MYKNTGGGDGKPAGNNNGGGDSGGRPGSNNGGVSSGGSSTGKKCFNPLLKLRVPIWVGSGYIREYQDIG